MAFPARTRRRLKTRDRIFTAALAEFRRAGVARAEIERIVAEAGVARGTFYLHFPTKDHVLMELLRRRQESVAQRLRAGKATSVGPFLRRLVALLLKDTDDEVTELGHDLFAAITRHAGEMQTEASGLLEVLTAFFADAQACGEIRDDLSPFELAAVFLPGVYGLIQLKLDSPRPDLATALHRAVDIFVRGITRASKGTET